MNHNANNVGEELSMKRFRFLSAMLAMALAFGMAFVGCSNDPDTEEPPVSGGSPVLTEFIVATEANINAKNWSPATTFSAGQLFGFAVRGVSHDNAVIKGEIKLGTYSLDVLTITPPIAKEQASFTHFFVGTSFGLDGAGSRSFEVYVEDEMGNKSNTLTTTITIR